VACINALCWSILSPPFQVPEEPAHFAYVQQLAEARELPVGSGEEYSPEEEVALSDLRHDYIQFVPSQGTISSLAQQRKLEHDLTQPLSGRGPGGAGRAASEPPLYYALETIPYALASSGTLLDQLELMRVLSALFGGLTALFAFMFVREALPGVRWAWTVGGLGVALAPLLGLMSGGVNPDAQLFAVSAALFYLLARAFRRGLTPRVAAAIGATTAIGLLTKLNFLGLAPGLILGLIAITLRTPPRSRARAYRALAIALAVGACPLLLYVASKSLTNPASVSFISKSTSSATQRSSVLDEISYIWQLYLPRLPGMSNYFPGVFTPRQLWFNGLVGLYGWADTVFPGWVDDLALIPASVLALLCLRALVAGRAALASRKLELLVYATMTAGVMTLVGIGSYANGRNGPFWEPRYLLPMLALLGAALALAARGAGRRWGPAVGATIVVLILAHDIFSQLLVVARYYG
jgi:4-amino-4-deoxy-L-arabinose transferase-like glycosyltransferase